MIATISFGNIVGLIAGAFVAGMLTGASATLYLFFFRGKK